ncbi:MAG: hypothetical protein D6782_04785, partial [Alphaproteobacteria bacterium]
AGGVLANPWLADEAAAARGLLRQHYGARLRSGAFWQRLMAGGVSLPGALRGLWRTLRQARRQAADGSLSQRMAHGMAGFGKPLACLLSARDDTAHAFRRALQDDRCWQMAQARAQMRLIAIAESDHVFASAAWRNAAAAATIDFLRSLAARRPV